MGNPFKGVGTGSTSPSDSQLDDAGHKSVPSGGTSNSRTSRPTNAVAEPSQGVVSAGKFHPKTHGSK